MLKYSQNGLSVDSAANRMKRKAIKLGALSVETTRRQNVCD